MDSEEEAKKLLSKSQIYDGYNVFEVLTDIEAGITAIMSFFLNRNKKKLEKIRDRLIIKINNSVPEELEDIIIESTINLSLATAKLKIIEEML